MENTIKNTDFIQNSANKIVEQNNRMIYLIGCLEKEISCMVRNSSDQTRKEEFDMYVNEVKEKSAILNLFVDEFRDS